jgi:hypothetical protein
MAVAASNSPAVESLPPEIRKQVDERLIASEPTRAISTWLSQQGHKVSFSAIARYNRVRLQPALSAAAKLQRIQQLESGTKLHPVDEHRAIADLTTSALAADPLLSHLAMKRQRNAQTYDKALVRENFGACAALDAADTRALDLEARLRGLLQATTSSTTIQVAVMYQAAPPAQIAESQGEIIDVDVAEVKRD